MKDKRNNLRTEFIIKTEPKKKDLENTFGPYKIENVFGRES